MLRFESAVSIVCLFVGVLVCLFVCLFWFFLYIFLGLTKELTRVEFEPSTSGLTCQHSTN